MSDKDIVHPVSVPSNNRPTIQASQKKDISLAYCFCNDKQMMQHDTYRRVRGRIRQQRWGE